MIVCPSHAQKLAVTMLAASIATSGAGWATPPPAPSIETGAGVTAGFVLKMEADEMAAEKEQLWWSIIAENPGVTCGESNHKHPRCNELIWKDVRRADYANASTALFALGTLATGSVIIYTLLEVQRVRVAPTLGGLTGSFQW